jgi:hypothetical protein
MSLLKQMKVDAPLRLVGLPASFVAGDEVSILKMESAQHLLAPTETIGTRLMRAGLIPASLLRWELTGEMPGEVRRMVEAR